MPCKWILLLFCITLTHSERTTSWKENDFKKFVKENLKEFKAKLQKNLDHTDTNPTFKKIQGSKTGLSFGECVKSLDDHILSRQQEINVISSKVKNVWMSSDTKKISILIVNGKILCMKGSKISRGQFDFKLNVSSILFLTKASQNIDNKIKLMLNDFEKALFKTRNQFLEGRLILKNVTLINSKIDEINDHVALNKVPTSRLTSALRRTGNQVIRNKMTIDNLSCVKSTIGYLNENKVEDFVQLNPSTITLTGSYRFGNVSATSIYVNGTINGQDINNIVLTSRNQIMHGIKEFKSLSASNIETSLLGEIRVDDLKKEMLDSTNSPLAVSILPTLIIQGNLKISSLNGNDIMQLFLNTVKTNKEQNISGEISFKSMVIDGNVNGKINNCSFEHFMTTNTRQSIFANMTFQNTTIFQNILTNSVNGVDLSKHAVIKSTKNVLKGRKTFAKNLNVSSITLKKGIPIDTFDPSAEISQIIQKTDVDNWKVFQFNSLNIGTINATDLEINVRYLPQLKNFENVWLKTTEQVIPRLKTKAMTVNKLIVSRVNNITLKDLVTVEGDVTIRKSCDFTQKIFTKTLRLGQKTSMNFSPEYWNSERVKVRVKDNDNIRIENALLKGNLIVGGTVQNFESDLMHVNSSQVIKGFVDFEKVKVKSLNFTEFNFEQINKTNIRTFLGNAVIAPINRSINNKHFKAITGSYMQCDGLLNNISLSNVVLKNSDQTITVPWKFVNAPTFRNITVKNFFSDIRLEDVIYTNKSKAINNKTFKGNITTNDLYASGYMNGVNISSLHKIAFNKSKDYSLESKLTFKRNVEMDKLQIYGSKINNINFEDIIRFDELNGSEIQNLSKVVVQNVNVSGLINGCDLQSVVENAFKHKISKTVTARTEAKNLKIEGKLKINNLMREKFDDWVSFLNRSSSPEIETEIELESINADNINFSKTVNYIPIDFLLKDAVLKNLEQNVTSKKYFTEIFAKKSDIENLDTKKIVGIDASKMYESYINKTENRMSTLLNTYIENLVSKQVFVTGKLNNLTLPNDVVLSNVNEVIMTEVVINNTVNVLSGLKIEGKINGMNIVNFIKRRVVLSANQEIFSSLVFNDDAILKGNTELNASINNIRLENALKNSLNQSINGNKDFSVLEILSNITVSGSINEARLEQFLWSSRNESVKEVQILKLNATDMMCDTINGVNIANLYNHMHIILHDMDDKLHRLTSDVLFYQDLLKSHEDVVENPLFGYFELHEVIKFGPVLKFLPAYEYGTIGEKYELEATQMVMWISKKENGCKKMVSYIADVSKNGTFNIAKQMSGRVFPFSLQIEREDNLIGFYVQAKYTPKCLPFIKSLIIKAIFQSVTEYEMYDSIILMPKGASLIDVQLLERNDDVYLIVAFNMKDPGERISLYYYDSSNKTWTQHQKFYMQNLSSLEINEYSLFAPPHVYLSVTGDKKNAGVTVYEWDFEVNKFEFITNLSTTVSTHAVWLYAHNKLYLLLAKEKFETIRNHTRVSVFNEPLEVYTLELDEYELELNNIVNIKGINFIEPFIFAGETFILATSSHMEIVYILQFRGYNSFEVIQEIPAAGVTEARIFNADNQLYLVLNSKTIKSRILKASVHGNRQHVKILSNL